MATYQVCGTANEGNNVTLTAPVGTTFTSVEFASYGTPSGTCGSFALGACHAVDSLSIVQSYVIGKNGTVTIPADNTTFGDPCYGTPKFLYVQATATSGVVPFSTTYTALGVYERENFAQEITLPVAPSNLSWRANVATTSNLSITVSGTLLVLQGQVVDAFANKKFTYLSGYGQDTLTSVSSFAQLPSSMYKAVSFTPDLNVTTSVIYYVTLDVIPTSIVITQTITNHWSYDNNNLIDNFIRLGAVDSSSNKSWYSNLQVEGVPEANLASNRSHGTTSFTTSSTWIVPDGVRAMTYSYLTTTGTTTKTIQVQPNTTFSIGIGNYGEPSALSSDYYLHATPPWTGVKVFQYHGNIDDTDYFKFNLVTTSSCSYANTTNTNQAGHKAAAAARGITLTEYGEGYHGDLGSLIAVNTISSSVVNMTFDSLQCYYDWNNSLAGNRDRGNGLFDVSRNGGLAYQPTLANNFEASFSPFDPSSSEGSYDYTIWAKQIVAITVTY